jgi:hypothetical protein
MMRSISDYVTAFDLPACWRQRGRDGDGNKKKVPGRKPNQPGD